MMDYEAEIQLGHLGLAPNLYPHQQDGSFDLVSIIEGAHLEIETAKGEI